MYKRKFGIDSYVTMPLMWNLIIRKAIVYLYEAKV